jgi:hypothetical protein
MKKLDDFGFWISDKMWKEGGWLDTTTKVGLAFGIIYLLIIGVATIVSKT